MSKPYGPNRNRLRWRTIVDPLAPGMAERIDTLMYLRTRPDMRNPNETLAPESRVLLHLICDALDRAHAERVIADSQERLDEMMYPDGVPEGKRSQRLRPSRMKALPNHHLARIPRVTRAQRPKEVEEDVAPASRMAAKPAETRMIEQSPAIAPVPASIEIKSQAEESVAQPQSKAKPSPDLLAMFRGMGQTSNAMKPADALAAPPKVDTRSRSLIEASVQLPDVTERPKPPAQSESQSIAPANAAREIAKMRVDGREF